MPRALSARISLVKCCTLVSALKILSSSGAYLDYACLLTISVTDYTSARCYEKGQENVKEFFECLT